VGEDEVAGLLCFGFETGAVAGDEEPVFDYSAEDADGAQGREFLAHRFGFVGEGQRGFCLFGEDEPEAVVLWDFRTVAEHEDYFVADVDGVAGEHGADFRFKGGEGFEDEGVGRGFAFEPCGQRGGQRGGEWVGDFGVARHGGRITRSGL
jgi:hypothetical protein